MTPRLLAIDDAPVVPIDAVGPAITGEDTDPAMPIFVAIGTIHADPAAFLLETLPRLATPLTDPDAGITLLCDDDAAAIDAAFAVPVVRAVLALLGIERDRCVSTDTGATAGARVLRPAATLDPDHLRVHRSHDRLLATVAERLAGPFGDRALAGKVHLSEHLEDDPIDRALAQSGWAVLRFGDRPLAETIGLVRGAATLSVSTIGAGAGWNAALTGFARPGATVRALVGPVLPPALLLSARIRGRPLEAWRVIGDGPPDRAKLLAPWCAVVDAPPAPRGRTRASSVEAGDTDAVLGGPPTGRARLRTTNSARPWWELDFGRVRPVRAVIIDTAFTRGEAPVALRLLGSPDLHDWAVLARDDEPAFRSALADAGPCRFRADPPWRLRGLRIQVGVDGVLALDRVVVDVADAGEDEDQDKW